MPLLDDQGNDEFFDEYYGFRDDSDDDKDANDGVINDGEPPEEEFPAEDDIIEPKDYLSDDDTFEE